MRVEKDEKDDASYESDPTTSDCEAVVKTEVGRAENPVHVMLVVARVAE